MQKINIQKLSDFTGHKNSVYTLCSGEENGIFYSSGAEGQVIEWNLNNENIGHLLFQIDASIYSIYAKNNILWILANGIGVFLIDIKNKIALKHIPIPKTTFYCMAQHKNKMFVGDNKGNLTVIDCEKQIVEKTINFSDKSFRCLAINELKNEMALGFSDAKILVLDLETLAAKKTLLGHENSVFSLVYDLKNQLLISAGRDAKIRLWNENYEPLNNVAAHIGTIHQLIYIKKEQLLVSASMDKSIKIWAMPDLKLLKVLDNQRYESHKSSINAILWMQQNETLIAASDDNKISSWKIF